MKKMILVTILAMGITSTTAFADEGGQKALVLRLFDVTNARATMDQITNSLETMMKQQLEALSGDLTPAGQEAAEVCRKEFVKWLSENVSWDQMRDVHVDIYARVFSEDELHGLLQFYQSPVGQRMLKKMPELIETTVTFQVIGPTPFQIN